MTREIGNRDRLTNDDMDRLIREVRRVADNLSSFSTICTIVLCFATAFVMAALLALVGCTP